MIQFLQPGWLLLLLPLFALTPRLGAGRLSRVMHLTVAILIILALAQPKILLNSKRGTLIVICDRSASMPNTPLPTDERLRETIAILQESQPSDSDLAVVTFGRNVNVEAVLLNDRFGGFKTTTDPSASRLSDAVLAALSITEKEGAARMLVVSDGEVESSSVAPLVQNAAARDVPIDYRHVARSTSGDVAIERFTAPMSVAPGESYRLSAWVVSEADVVVEYELRRGNTVLSTEEVAVRSGMNRLEFRDLAPGSGVQEYQLRINVLENPLHTEPPYDAVRENNTARTMVAVDGPKPILHIHAGESGLGDLLKQGGLDVESKSGDDLSSSSFTLARVGRYSSIILENIPADLIGPQGMETLRDWVTHTGGGLMFTGGRNSYAVGGYYQSPLDEIMPVSMELREENRKASVSIVVVLDRSGSMTAPAGGGKTKMDLANMATAQVYDMLSEIDEFGCIAVDSTPHTVVPLGPVDSSSRGKILSIESMGGGIFVYEGLQAAARQLQDASGAARHIILFADAADAEEPGEYRALLAALQSAGITCSVIGLGTKQDPDAALLEEIAKLGNGRCFFSNQAGDLPRLFAQDTFVVARNSFLDEALDIRTTAGMTMFTEQRFGEIPNINGYNLCYLRPRATMAIVGEDEYHSPVMAGWRAGLGRVLCYTGEADGQYTGPIGQWSRNGDFFTSMARWSAGHAQPLPSEMLVVAEMREDAQRVRLYLDPDREGELFEEMPTVHALVDREGGTPERVTLPMYWANPDTLEARIPVDSKDAVLTSVDVPSVGVATLAPACALYCMEYRPRRPGEGLDNLRRIAQGTGGEPRDDLTGIWDAMPKRSRYLAIAPWLALASLGLVLIETLQRRTGLLSEPLKALKIRRQKTARQKKGSVVSNRQKKWRKKIRKLEEREKPPEETPLEATPPPVESSSEATILDAFQRASRKTDARTKWHKDD
jgi:uncharacterized membrane protein